MFRLLQRLVLYTLTSKVIVFFQQFESLIFLVLPTGLVIFNDTVGSTLSLDQTMFGQLMAIASYSNGELKYMQV